MSATGTAHVLQNPDLMRIVLLNNVGAATAIATGCVCRVWREAAARDVRWRNDNMFHNPSVLCARLMKFGA